MAVSAFGALPPLPLISRRAGWLPGKFKNG